MTKDENVMTEKDSGTIEDDKIADDKMTAARYVEYSRVALEGAVDNRRVLFFMLLGVLRADQRMST